MAMRTKAVNPEQTKHVKEVEKKIREWKVNSRYLSEIGDTSRSRR